MTDRSRLGIGAVLTIMLVWAVLLLVTCFSESSPALESPALESPALESPIVIRGVGMRISVYEASLAPLGDQTITDLGSATALSVPSGAVIAWIEAIDGKIRWRDSGSDPTASVGGIIFAGDKLIYNGDLDAIKLIEESSADAFVSYYRWN